MELSKAITIPSQSCSPRWVNIFFNLGEQSSIWPHDKLYQTCFLKNELAFFLDFPLLIYLTLPTGTKFWDPREVSLVQLQLACKTVILIGNSVKCPQLTSGTPCHKALCFTSFSASWVEPHMVTCLPIYFSISANFFVHLLFCLSAPTYFTVVQPAYPRLLALDTSMLVSSPQTFPSQVTCSTLHMKYWEKGSE